MERDYYVKIKRLYIKYIKIKIDKNKYNFIYIIFLLFYYKIVIFF